MKFHIKTNSNGQAYFNLVGRNGQVIMTSESYKRKSGALKSINRINERVVPPFPVVDKT